jgi:hypothetical protein
MTVHFQFKFHQDLVFHLSAGRCLIQGYINIETDYTHDWLSSTPAERAPLLFTKTSNEADYKDS